MAEENSSFSVGENLDLASDSVDGMFASSRRSGSLNSVTNGKPLYYPSDLLAADNPNAENTNGIVSWLEFRIFFKQNGSLSSVVKKTKSGLGNIIADVASGFDQTDETEGETVQTILENLQFSDDEIQKSIATESVTSDTRLGKGTEETNDSVFLYVPGGIEYNDSMQYEEVGFAGIRNLSSVSASASTVALGVLKKLAGTVDKAAGALGQESLNSEQAITAELGVVMNPRKEQIFQGIDMRSFVYNFTFIPRNKEEAKTVADIIKVFRFHAYPELSANSAFFNFPSEFEIKHRVYDSTEGGAVKDNPVVPKLNRCFLEKITTNYTPDEVYYAFKNGMPPKITLSLSFKEAEYITRQHVNEGF